jgi:hypothetical protein
MRRRVALAGEAEPRVQRCEMWLVTDAGGDGYRRINELQYRATTGAALNR